MFCSLFVVCVLLPLLSLLLCLRRGLQECRSARLREGARKSSNGHPRYIQLTGVDFPASLVFVSIVQSLRINVVQHMPFVRCVCVCPIRGQLCAEIKGGRTVPNIFTGRLLYIHNIHIPIRPTEVG